MEPKINYSYTIWFFVSLMIMSFNLGYTFISFTVVSKFLYEQFGVAREDKWKFDTMISLLVPVGAIFGAPLAGWLVEYGRRNAILITTGAFIGGAFITCITHVAALFAGRLVMGI